MRIKVMMESVRLGREDRPALKLGCIVSLPWLRGRGRSGVVAQILSITASLLGSQAKVFYSAVLHVSVVEMASLHNFDFNLFLNDILRSGKSALVQSECDRGWDYDN